MGVLHFWWSIRKLTFFSMVRGSALIGILTKPMLMLPDQVGWLGMVSIESSSPLLSFITSGGFSLGI
jgi:hypothetical protein